MNETSIIYSSTKVSRITHRKHILDSAQTESSAHKCAFALEVHRTNRHRLSPARSPLDRKPRNTTDSNKILLLVGSRSYNSLEELYCMYIDENSDTALLAMFWREAPYAAQVLD